MNSNDDSSIYAADLEWARQLALSLTHDADLADDLVQETMEARVRRPEVASHAHPKGWLGTVLRNRANQHHRSRRRREAREAHVSRADWHDGDPDAAGRKEIIGILHRAMERLDPEIRELIQMRYLEDLGVSAIAEQVGLSTGAVEYRLQKGRAMLRSLLGHEFGIDPRHLASALFPVLGLPFREGSPTAGATPSRHPRRTWLPLVAAGAALLTGMAFLPGDDAMAGGQGEALAERIEGSNAALSPEQATGQTTRLHEPALSSLETGTGGALRIRASRKTTGEPVEGAGLTVLHLQKPDLQAAGFEPDAWYLYFQQSPTWRVLHEERVWTDASGTASVTPITEAEAIKVLRGGGTEAWAFGRRIGAAQDYGLSRAVAGWPDLDLELQPREIGLAGKVTTLDGQVVPGAEVHYWFEIPTDRAARPDRVLPVAADGSFSLPQGAAIGHHVVLQASAPGHLPARQFRFRPTEAGDLDGLALHLIPTSPLLVQIHDAASRPIEGVRIRAMPVTDYTREEGDWQRWFGALGPVILTDQAGQATVPIQSGLPSTLFVSHPHYLHLHHAFRPRDQGNRLLELRLEERPLVSGQVLGPDGRALSQVAVRMASSPSSVRGTTDAEGSFLLGLQDPEAPVRVLVDVPGLGVGWSPALPPERSRGITLHLDASGILAGQVRDPEGAPNVAALHCYPVEQVESDPHQNRSWIGEDRIQMNDLGRFRIEGIPAGEYLLQYRTASGDTWTLQAWSGSTDLVLAPETRNGSFGSLRIRPRLSPDLPPETKAKFRLLRQDDPMRDSYTVVLGNLVPDELGEISTALLPEGPHVLCAYHTGRKFHQHFPAEVVAGREARSMAHIVPGRNVEVRFVDPQGQPLIGFRALPVNSQGLIAPAGMRGPLPTEGMKGFRRKETQDRQFFGPFEDDPDMRLLIIRNRAEEVLFETRLADLPRDGETVTVLIPDDYR